MSGKVVVLGILLMVVSGCGTTTVFDDFPCPPRPTLEPISPEEQMAMDPSVLGRIAQNQLRLKSYAKKLEARAGCEW